MKIATSTGDFSCYETTVENKVKDFKNTKFKYINLEQTGKIPELLEDDDAGWQRLADVWGNAAAEAGVEYVVSHAPCLNVFDKLTEENYNVKLRAIRRSIEICNILGINRIVVHSCLNDTFTPEVFYSENKRFYTDLFDLMEKYNITVMTENWDHTRHPVGTGKQLRDFVDYVDHPLLAICWDTAHANICKESREMGQYENILATGDKLKGLHISDNFGDTHHHSWPFAGKVNFDSIMQGLIDVNYDGYFTFEASYTLLHENNLPLGGWPYKRDKFEYKGETVTKLRNPSVALKQKAVDLLYDVGQYILEAYDCFEE